MLKLKLFLLVLFVVTVPVLAWGAVLSFLGQANSTSDPFGDFGMGMLFLVAAFFDVLAATAIVDSFKPIDHYRGQ